MHQSIPAVPIPPRATTGHLLKCQSRGWGISNFIAARGLGISLVIGQRSVNNQVLKKKILLQLCVSKTMIIVFFKHCERDCRYFSRNIQNKWLL